MHVIERIDAWARGIPDQIAHRSGGRSLTYRQLSHASDILAGYLAHTLSDDAAPVGVLGHKEPEMLIAFLAAIKANHPYVPIDTATPPQRVETILKAAGARICLTPEQVIALVEAYAHAPLLRPPLREDPSAPWYIMFTSGSTGEPKGVIITAGCLESFLDWMLSEHRFETGAEIFLNQAPFSFDLSVMDLYPSLLTGGALSSLNRDEIANPKQLFQSLGSSGATTWVSTPSFAELCLSEPSFTAGLIPQLRRFLFCGETLSPELAAGLIGRFPQAEVWNTYGPTETTVAVTSVRIDPQMLRRYSPLPVGYPKPGALIRLLLAEGTIADECERGEILIGGASVSPGYIGRPDLTQRAFFELDGQRLYRTGDVGHFEDGLLFFDGRIDSQIKLHGYRIELGDVEANLQAIQGVQDAVVLAVVKKGRPDSLAAFVILSGQPANGDYETTRSLRKALGQRLPAYMIPRQFQYLTAFPLTTNGKVDRRKLAESLA